MRRLRLLVPLNQIDKSVCMCAVAFGKTNLSDTKKLKYMRRLSLRIPQIRSTQMCECVPWHLVEHQSVRQEIDNTNVLNM